MHKLSMSHSLILAAALAAGGIAHAQTRAAETTNTPQRAGEASTVTGGAPNAATTNAVTTPRPTGATARPAETANVPPRAGEASTMTGGAPNAQTSNAVTTDKKKTSVDRKAAMPAGTTGKAADTTNVPTQAGQASTMTGGAPNAKTTN